MQRRSLLKKSVFGLAAGLIGTRASQARTFLTGEQAMRVLAGSSSPRKVPVTLSSAQTKAIKSASGVRVRNKSMQVWKTSSGGWFIIDQVIGKHENIDYAVALSSAGKVKGIEVLVYRETYGHEIMNSRWRAQFHGRGSESTLKLDREIKNIGGATLSCAHITDGINRLTKTWELVLRHL